MSLWNIWTLIQLDKPINLSLISFIMLGIVEETWLNGYFLFQRKAYVVVCVSGPTWCPSERCPSTSTGRPGVIDPQIANRTSVTQLTS